MDKLLIINSDDTTKDLMYDILCDSDFELYTASNGKIALLKIPELKPDIVILYSDLSDMSGFDICKRIKDDEHMKYTMVLLVLSLETNSYIKRALHAGADDYISTDTSPTILLAKLNSFVRMKHLNDKINEQYNQLKEKDKLINFQLRMAQKVQRSIIREIDTKVGEIHITSKYLPVLEIGGDFFDVKQIDDNHIGIILGDVSGHGISAALLTSMLNMMFSSLYMTYKKPNELLAAMNSQFCSIFYGSDTQMYACIFYAIADLAENRIVYSNAGQSFPIYVSQETQEAFQLELSGTPIGILSDTKYSNNTISYNNGDTLFLHTDGLTDFSYKDRPEEFDDELKKLLIECMQENYSTEMTIDAILHKFYSFDNSKKFESDDVSMLLCTL